MDKRFVVADPITEEYKKQFPELEPVVLQLLYNRGIKTQEDIDIFLGPDWSRDTNPFSLFMQMNNAVDRVFYAIENNQVITVHGDYDADGVCGSTILLETIRSIAEKKNLKIDCNGYIPHREKEGYGLNIDTVIHLKDHEKTDLIITVDCGISNKIAIDKAKELGMDVIVCDHHVVPEELPDAILIHPLVLGETYPNKFLCGTGVAYKFACGLIDHARKNGVDFIEGHEKWLLDLVSIATVTDMVPLSGENRVLEKFGLMVLNKTKRIGLLKLIEVMGSKVGKLDTYSVGFQIGPRINAAGRMNHANEALYLLLEKDPEKAKVMAEDLNKTNIERQKISEQMYRQAKAQIGEGYKDKLIVAVQEGWSAGLVGLVAGKLLNDYHKPVFVMGKEGDKYVGSGRSIEGFNILTVLLQAEDHFDRFGGHPQACGFSITSKENFDSAVEKMKKYVNENLKDDDLAPVVHVDAKIELEDINWELFNHAISMAPFGMANPRPLFMICGCHVIGCEQIGSEGKHLRMTVANERGRVQKMIGFFKGSLSCEFGLSDKINVVFELGENEWNGNKELQVKIIDIQKA
ncbi:MAG: single-stranded-DNA-specific exonuclease RecJ [Patescibacteria group bacterium]